MTPWLADPDVVLYHGDALSVLRELPDGEADACVTSPPYLDARPEYPSPSLAQFEEIFRELGRVVTGPMLLNVGRLWRNRRELLWWVDLLERADWAGWPLVDTRIWIKPNANPIHGEILANSHEYIFMLGEGFDVDAVRTEYAEGSRERLERKWLRGAKTKGNDEDQHGRDEHPIGARPRSFMVGYVGKEKGNEHPAPMPVEVAEELIRLSGGTCVLDPFAGAGATAVAARKLHRRSIGIDLNESYLQLAARRLQQQSLFADAP